MKSRRAILLNQELNKIVEAVKNNYKPQKIILFGSLAKGDVQENTDIDLLIIKRTNQNPWQRAEEVDKFIQHTLPVDLLIYTPEEIKERLLINDFFIKEIMEKGRLIYEST